MAKDEIYIDCQPVDSEGETLVKYNLSKHISSKVKSIDYEKKYNEVLNSPYLGLILGAAGLVVLVKGSKMLMKLL